MSLESSGNSLPYAAEPFCRPRTAILDLGSLIGIYPQSHRQFDPYSNNLVGEPITKEIQIDYSIIPLCDQSTAAGLHCITEMGIIPPSDLKHAIDLAVEHSGERPWGMLNPISPITSTLVSMIGLKPEGLVTYAGIYTSLLYTTMQILVTILNLSLSIANLNLHI